MTYQQLLEGIALFGSGSEDVCLHAIGVRREQIRERVIIAPWWKPALFEGLSDEITLLSSSDFASVLVWDIKTPKFYLTYIRTGIGAPIMLDVILALGLTACRHAVFIGSVGSLDPDIGIGDIVIPEYSVCGDGASRYLADGPLGKNDIFGQKAYPSEDMFQRLLGAASHICEKNEARCHVAQNFSIDTILAQFARIREIQDMGCNVIEMETAAAFRAAKMAGISLGALFCVSDNTVTSKSLLSGRIPGDMTYRNQVRATLFPKILLEAFPTGDVT